MNIRIAVASHSSVGTSVFAARGYYSNKVFGVGVCAARPPQDEEEKMFPYRIDFRVIQVDRGTFFLSIFCISRAHKAAEMRGSGRTRSREWIERKRESEDR